MPPSIAGVYRFSAVFHIAPMKPDVNSLGRLAGQHRHQAGESLGKIAALHCAYLVPAGLHSAQTIHASAVGNAPVAGVVAPGDDDCPANRFPGSGISHLADDGALTGFVGKRKN